MESKYDMTIEEAYEKIAELENKLETIDFESFLKDLKILEFEQHLDLEKKMTEYIKLETLFNTINLEQIIHIYIKDEYSFRYHDANIIIGKNEDPFDNKRVKKYMDCYVCDMWACGEDEIKIAIWR